MKNAPIRRLWLLSATFAVLLANGTAFAHSGGTNSEGCHTNSKTGDYHCHNGGTSGGGSTGGSSTYTPTYTTQPSCPSGQHYDMYSNQCSCPTNMEEDVTGTCVCRAGFITASTTYCVRLPTHAHGDKNGADGWSCDTGYEKLGNSCNKVAPVSVSSSSKAKTASSAATVKPSTETVKVTSVVDGDTIKVKLGTKTETIRVIGIDTPETVDPRKPVQCYGKEAAAQMKKLVTRKTVTLEKNPAEERDKYGRLLRYVFIGSKDIGATLIQDGYAFSYKVFPHPKLDAYNALETKAQETKKGLWGAACNTATSTSSKTKSSSSASSKATTTSGACDIKGNINSSGEKIFHLPGCASYKQTVIDISTGERMFCSESEALNAGWRKALNCP